MNIKQGIAATCVIWSSFALAGDPELHLLSEHPVEGMRGGNLSGLALCGEHLWTISDRDDDRIYRLDSRADVWKAEAVAINVPPVPADAGRTLAMKIHTLYRSLVRNASLDFEGISCDDAGNRYILSETYSAVLQVTPQGQTSWLNIAPQMVEEARKAGMLLHANALFEGLAISGAGNDIWLAGERQKRGLVHIAKPKGKWACAPVCVTLSEGGLAPQPPQFPGSTPVEMDFSDISLFNGKLFLLDRNAFKVCRHALSGAQERCWSFAADALVAHRQYPGRHGLTEALIVDDKGAWIGTDNNGVVRNDGEARPTVWRFAVPEGGWNG